MKKTPLATAIGGGAVGSSILMPQSGEYSLYFHVPFCTKKCHYCHFYVIPDQERHKTLYLQSLRKEWELRAATLPSHSPISIYFGGGTPALLGPGPIQEILSWINPPPSCEITLEVNPDNVTLSLMQAFKEAGINRVSLGVQTLDDPLLQLLSRTHSARRSWQAVIDTAEAGISNITIDLMYDLPNQTLNSWENTLKKALELPISHLSLYNLTIEPHTVFFKKRKSLTLPDSETSLSMLNMAVSLLEAEGLHRYEISAFAKPGFYSKHNTGYWLARPFLGFGPSAFSYWEKSRFRNIANLNKYAKALEKKQDPIDFSEKLDDFEQAKELLAISLRLLQGADLSTLPPSLMSGLIPLEHQGLLERQGSRILLTSQGLLFHDSVAEHIMSL